MLAALLTAVFELPPLEEIAVATLSLSASGNINVSLPTAEAFLALEGVGSLYTNNMRSTSVLVFGAIGTKETVGFSVRPRSARPAIAPLPEFFGEYSEEKVRQMAKTLRQLIDNIQKGVYK